MKKKCRNCKNKNETTFLQYDGNIFFCKKCEHFTDIMLFKDVTRREGTKVIQHRSRNNTHEKIAEYIYLNILDNDQIPEDIPEETLRQVNEHVINIMKITAQEIALANQEIEKLKRNRKV